MARIAKKQLKEETEVVKEGTAAAESLKPNSHPAEDPKSKAEMIAKMVGASLAMQDNDLLKHFNSMMSYHSQVGHGMGVGDVAGRNNATHDMHPSDATHEHSYGKEKMATPHLAVKEAIKQDVSKLLDGEDGLSGEFKDKATTLFEAAVDAQVNAILVEMEDTYNKRLDEEIQGLTEELLHGVDNYLDYVAKEWLTENQVAIESALRNQMTAEFIEGLRNLFLQHNANIPEEQVDIVDTLATKVDELESRVNDLITDNGSLKEKVAGYEKKEVVEKLSEGLTLQQTEKLRELSETVDADDIEAFTKKVTVIKESNFVKGTPKKKTETLNETMEAVDEDNAPAEDNLKNLAPQMQSYMKAISRTLRPL